MKFEAIVIGTSAGGLFALSTILSALPADFSLPVIIVQHRSKMEPSLLEEVLSKKCLVAIKQADEKEDIKAGLIYFAPADYHLLIEKDRSFSLSFDPPVNFSRPSIDILFETAAYAYGKNLLALILTGANHDGAKGIRMIKSMGGTCIAQDPAEADYPAMPQAAIDTGSIHKILTLERITEYLLSTGKN